MTWKEVVKLICVIACFFGTFAGIIAKDYGMATLFVALLIHGEVRELRK